MKKYRFWGFVVALTMSLSLCFTGCNQKTQNASSSMAVSSSVFDSSTLESETETASQNSETGPASSGETESESSNEAGNESSKPESLSPDSSESEQLKYACKINITINPEIDLLTDENGIVTSYEFKNEDAKDAYSDLELVGLSVEEASEKLVTAAADKGYLTDGHGVELALEETNLEGELTLQQMSSAMTATQQVLNVKNFAQSVISMEVETSGANDQACDLCNGAGIVICDQCGGKVLGNGCVPCEECNVTGVISCDLCNGTKVISCDQCGGSNPDCPSCNGTGSANCFRCGGAGNATCTNCDGTGSRMCNRCNGSAMMICNRCNGTKVISN